jgi:hypothetical protein
MPCSRAWGLHLLYAHPCKIYVPCATSVDKLQATVCLAAAVRVLSWHGTSCDPTIRACPQYSASMASHLSSSRPSLLTIPRCTRHCRKGTRLQMKMKVEVISFSAHADFEQTSGFLDVVQPPHVVLVHGELEGMKRLRHALANNALQNRIERHMHMPSNGSTVAVGGWPAASRCQGLGMGVMCWCGASFSAWC